MKTVTVVFACAVPDRTIEDALIFEDSVVAMTGAAGGVWLSEKVSAVEAELTGAALKAYRDGHEDTARGTV